MRSQMDDGIKALWLKALRSGEYPQGRFILRNGDKFCCMGVLCDVLDPSGWEKIGTHKCSLFSHKTRTQFPHEEIKQEAGIGRDVFNRLAEMNDKEGVNFSDIADWIEANL